jgi:hypothetical protein
MEVAMVDESRHLPAVSRPTDRGHSTEEDRMTTNTAVCRCTIGIDDDTDDMGKAYVIRCALHGAAHEMYGALVTTLQDLRDGEYFTRGDYLGAAIMDRLNTAIAHARGKR